MTKRVGAVVHSLADHKELNRLRGIVRRQDKAIDAGVAALGRLAQKGSITKEMRETALNELTLARNERLQGIR